MPRRSALALIPLGLAAVLCGCAGEPLPFDGTTYPQDYRVRHPILLSQQPARLAVIPRWAYGLDPRQADDVRAFGHAFRTETMGVIQVSVPVVAGRPTPLVKTNARAVRTALVGTGIDARNIRWSEYDATGLGPQSPLNLSFAKLTATVPHPCNDWPYDLAAGAGFESFQNEPYWNLGCASQTNLALQAADPLDLVRPRVEGPADTVKRVNDIQQLRTGNDPSTDYGPTAASASGS
ncbi:CpaD family pilus assembly protein [Aquabacter spiritensis]|uniref:Pilus assembly protein CpaD n=1 Tax=Aquabacter spiritensis TaxID=933073 RepID=A0A4R3M2X7_9HYPH|nr:CpaD family pilus assembly protein [Aquabacter spiritensis]TCT07510.1 pilus assembly protein CpaD [Aquabacter spiritensis]